MSEFISSNKNQKPSLDDIKARLASRATPRNSTKKKNFWTAVVATVCMVLLIILISMSVYIITESKPQPTEVIQAND